MDERTLYSVSATNDSDHYPGWVSEETLTVCENYARAWIARGPRHVARIYAHRPGADMATWRLIQTHGTCELAFAHCATCGAYEPADALIDGRCHLCNTDACRACGDVNVSRTDPDYCWSCSTILHPERHRATARVGGILPAPEVEVYYEVARGACIRRRATEEDAIELARHLGTRHITRVIRHTMGVAALALALTLHAPTLAHEANGHEAPLPIIGTPAYDAGCAITGAWEDGSATAYCPEDGASYTLDAETQTWYPR